MENLAVTDYGTIKGEDDFKEIKIDKFLKQIEKGVKTQYTYSTENDSSFTVNKATITMKDQDNYCITIIKKNYDDKYYCDEYCLNITDCVKFYPLLKSKLDELKELSDENLFIVKTINEFETSGNLDSTNNYNNLKIYLEYLAKIRKKCRRKKILYILRALFGSFFPISTILAFTNQSSLWAGISLITIAPLLSTILAELGNSILNLDKSIFRTSKLTNLKIKEVAKRLNKVTDINLKIATEKQETIVKRDIYKDTIINYMNNIMEGANKLNTRDRREKLIELKSILEEYTSKSQNLKNNSSGLTLENSERAIVTEIIDKLTTLEMEIAELIKRDQANQKITSESDLLMKHIDEYLKVIEQDETKLDINNKKKILSKNEKNILATSNSNI